MAGFRKGLDKFLLLMWKNWRLQLRHPIQTAFEILVPVIFCAILVVVRSLAGNQLIDPYNPKPFNPSNPCINAVTLNEYTLAYSPNHEKVKEIMEAVVKNMPACYAENTQILDGYDTSQKLEIAMIANPKKNKVGVVFPDDFDKLPEKMEFSIRFPSELQAYSYTGSVDTWKTNLLYPTFQLPGARDSYRVTADPNYAEEGFLLLQSLVSNELLQQHAKKNGSAVDNPKIMLQRFPYPAFVQDVLLEVMKQMISLIIVLAFQYTAISIIKVITTEKEKQLKEAMKIMGLPGWLHWLAWFAKSFSFMIITVILMVTLLKVDAWYDYDVPAVLPKTNFILLFIFLILFVIATITLCFAISTFFTQANMAAGIGGVTFFLFMVPYSLLSMRYQDLSLDEKLGASLMSNTAMAYGFQLICTFESAGTGLQWENLFESVTPDDNLTMAHIFLMLIIDSIIYMCIALYVEAIYPGKYGVAKKWYFIFTWPFKKETSYKGEILGGLGEDRDKFEEEPSTLKAGIAVKGLTKTYGSKTVVNQIHLNMYEDQITVLLGHNGAGKTTTMSMLTGLEVPTCGTAMINQYDLRTQMTKVRGSLGLCPQHNILFDELTVAEHIYFFSRLKGLSGKVIEQEIDDYLKLLKLEDKRDKQSNTLSGGMKRKLSVAVAFCGGSKVVMLDEPTAGMDPSARRALWEMVESQKKGRTIMLTTHFMDEADLLGDRIAIMAAGELQCCGSSFFLKKRYGAGYRLIMDKLPNCNVNEVTNVFKQFIPHIQIDSNIGSELSYLLGEEDSIYFEKMLTHLEENLERFNIGSYGISLTTLEEVFMKVGADNTLHNMMQSESNNTNGDLVSDNISINIGSSRHTGWRLLKNQLLAMIMKRALSTIRSWQMLLVQCIIPILLLAVAIISGQQSGTKELPELKFSLNSYRKPLTLFTCHDPVDATCEAMKEWLGKESLEYTEVNNIRETILDVIKKIPGTFRSSYIFGAEFMKSGNILGWFNNEPYHTPPLVLNNLYNAIFKAKNADFEISVTNWPLPLTTESKFQLLQVNNMGFNMSINIGFCMSFISAFYILFYVRERVCKAKHLQFVSGINVFTFWIVSYIWDWCTYIVTIVILIITLICFQEDGFKEGESIGNLLLIFFYFGFAMLPFVYVFSFLYELPSTAFMRVILIAILVGIFGFIITEILYFDGLELVHVAKALDWIFLFIPYYSLSNGIRNTNFEFMRVDACNKLVDACLEQEKKDICKSLVDQINCGDNCKNLLTFLCNLLREKDLCWLTAEGITRNCAKPDADYYNWLRPGIGRNIAFTFIIGAILVVLLFMLEFKVFNWIIYKFNPQKPYMDGEMMDDDVLAEMNKVRQMSGSEISHHNLILKNMTKYYKSFPAVKGLCLAVDKYECFGLLGVNGAGKTTSFKMITGDTDISSGDVFVQGLDLKYRLKEVYKYIGYCPQFDALFDDLTGRETITVFCLLRGYDRSETNYIAETLAKRFDFYQHLDKKVREMSGGNKRKLSTSVALIGDPPIIYLDEPTTGMDPATKRHLWNALCKLRDEGKCLILTTHSMEECEALCTRLAIMVSGQFKCIGSTQHLKNKFARGFSLTVKLKKQIDYTEPMHRLVQFVVTNLPSAIAHEQHQEMITFSIPNSGLPWSKMFGIMEGSKQQLEIEDYSLGQSSLEQVFLRFTLAQN